jgi:NADPH-dependent ferric siderophore reductase
MIMKSTLAFKLEGTAVTADPIRMLDEIGDHFVEHAQVQRTDGNVQLTNKLGLANFRVQDRTLLIDLAGPTESAIQISRTLIAEHLFYFAGRDPLELTWSRPAASNTIPNLREATVVSAENVTPLMRRVKFSCADITPFVGGDMHVRILAPPKGRAPVWPSYRKDGRLSWPTGEDALLVRPYTIRAVDAERQELWIDFFQHEEPEAGTPGADFARDAKFGDLVALLGPGSGKLPRADTILLVGDESALPAIARIVAEVPGGTRIRALIEVTDGAEEQPLPTAGKLDIRWLHRNSYAVGAKGVLAGEAERVIQEIDAATFVWVACEKADVRSIKSELKRRGHERRLTYAAWYWQR